MQTSNTHLSKAEREAHKSAWQQSGLSKTEYCKQHQLRYYTFCSWFKKARVQKETTAQKFIPLEVVTHSAAVSPFATVRYADQVIVDLHREVSATFIKQLITCR